MGVDVTRLKDVVKRFEREAREADERLTVLERACDAADAEATARKAALERAAACEARAAGIEEQRAAIKGRILDAMAEDDDEAASDLKAERKALAGEAERALEEARKHREEAERHNTVDSHLFGRVAAYAYHPGLPSWGDFAGEAEEAMREVVAGLNRRAYKLEEERTHDHWDEGVYHEIRFGKGASHALSYAWSYGGLKEKTLDEAAAFSDAHPPTT
jgi:hypothetical protein